MNKELHFKQESVNPYMASEDLLADKGHFITTVLTIGRIAIEQNLFNHKIGNTIAMWKIAYFNEKVLPNGVKVKPMVINAVVNLRTMVNGTGFVDMNKWTSARVTVGVQTGLMGKVGGKTGLRILEVHTEKPILPEKMIERAKVVFKEKGSLASIEAHYRLTDEQVEEIKNGCFIE